MRIITVPETVNLNILGQAWTFALCVEHVVDNAPEFNQTGKGIRAGGRILDGVGRAGPGEQVELRQDDWQLLAQAMQEPPAGYHPKLYRVREDKTLGDPIDMPTGRVRPYIDAVEQATDTEAQPLRERQTVPPPSLTATEKVAQDLKQGGE